MPVVVGGSSPGPLYQPQQQSSALDTNALIALMRLAETNRENTARDEERRVLTEKRKQEYAKAEREQATKEEKDYIRTWHGVDIDKQPELTPYVRESLLAFRAARPVQPPPAEQAAAPSTLFGRFKEWVSPTPPPTPQARVEASPEALQKLQAATESDAKQLYQRKYETSRALLGKELADKFDDDLKSLSGDLSKTPDSIAAAIKDKAALSETYARTGGLLGKEERDKALHASALAKSQADARRAAVEANVAENYAMGQAQATLKKTQGDAEIATQDAKYAATNAANTARFKNAQAGIEEATRDRQPLIAKEIEARMRSEIATANLHSQTYQKNAQINGLNQVLARPDTPPEAIAAGARQGLTPAQVARRSNTILPQERAEVEKSLTGLMATGESLQRQSKERKDTAIKASNDNASIANRLADDWAQGKYSKPETMPLLQAQVRTMQQNLVTEHNAAGSDPSTLVRVPVAGLIGGVPTMNYVTVPIKDLSNKERNAAVANDKQSFPQEPPPPSAPKEQMVQWQTRVAAGAEALAKSTFMDLGHIPARDRPDEMKRAIDLYNANKYVKEVAKGFVDDAVKNPSGQNILNFETDAPGGKTNYFTPAPLPFGIGTPSFRMPNVETGAETEAGMP